MNDKPKPALPAAPTAPPAPPPAPQKPAVDPAIAAIRASVREQSAVQTRFEAGRFKRQETGAKRDR